MQDVAENCYISLLSQYKNVIIKCTLTQGQAIDYYQEAEELLTKSASTSILGGEYLSGKDASVVKK